MQVFNQTSAVQAVALGLKLLRIGHFYINVIGSSIVV